MDYAEEDRIRVKQMEEAHQRSNAKREKEERKILDEFIRQKGTKPCHGHTSTEMIQGRLGSVVNLDELVNVSAILTNFDKQHTSQSFDPVPYITRLADLLIIEEQNKSHIESCDPLNISCNPSQNCSYDHQLKIVTSNDTFMRKLTGDYILDGDSKELLNCEAARLLIQLSPSLKAAPFFQDIRLVQQLFSWAETHTIGHEALQFYAVGLLAIALKLPEMAEHFKNKNVKLVQLMLNQLLIHKEQEASTVTESNITGACKTNPLTDSMRHTLILRYLTANAELSATLFLQNSFNADTILSYIDLDKSTEDSKLVFETLQFLGVLLLHNKFAVDFINRQGLARLLQYPNSSIAAVGVSMCLYYIGCCPDAMDRVSLLPEKELKGLVLYVLSLFESAYESGRCYAAMFLQEAFYYRPVLDHFNAQAGLKLLYDKIITLPILWSDAALRDDLLYDEQSRHYSGALKSYFQAHLACILQEHGFQRSKATLQREELYKLVMAIQQHDMAVTSLPVVDCFVGFGGISVLLRLLATSSKLYYNGRLETVRNIMDIMCVCSLSSTAQTQICEWTQQLPSDANVEVGINILLGAAHGDLVADPKVQCAALATLINLVCALRVEEDVSNSKRLEMMWESLVQYNGIAVLEDLLSITKPIMDADSIRSLACKALLGLSHSENVRKIMEQRPLFTSGQLQVLMKQPVLQDNIQEHAMFQNYGLELLKKVWALDQTKTNELVDLETKIAKEAELVKKDIMFNKEQLLQLANQHFLNNDLTKSAVVLLEEAGLSPPPSRQAKSRISFKTTTSIGSIPKTTSLAYHNYFHGSAIESGSTDDVVSLDSIVTGSLGNQHALCPTPLMIAKQELDSFTPQSCVEAEGSRMMNDTRIYSHPKLVRTFETDNYKKNTCFTYSPCEQFLLVGDMSGTITSYKVHSTNQWVRDHDTFFCEDDGNLLNIEISWNGDLLLTSSTTQACLRSFEDINHVHYQLHDINHAELSKIGQDRIVGSKSGNVYIYDVSTGSKLMTLKETAGLSESRIYRSFKSLNWPTFHRSNKFVMLGDTVWDANSGVQIHKIAGLDDRVGSKFHPKKDYEIIASSGIWDMRTFRQLTTVQELYKCKPIFSYSGDVIYAIELNECYDGMPTYDWSFKIIDGTDYSLLDTIDACQYVHGLCINKSDTQIAVGGDVNSWDTPNEAKVRLYDVSGRNHEEEEDEDCDGEEDLDWALDEDEEVLDNEPSDEDDNNMEDDGTDPMVTTSVPN